MKYLILSDIHGCIESAQIAIEKFKKYNCDKILLLGDILYHGPRNDLPTNYNPKEVVILLNKYKDKIIAAKGNCDALVDEMVLEFKLEELVKIDQEGKNIYLTHGHVYLPTNPLKEAKNKDIVFYGHTHVSKIENIDGVYYINPGSITLPKENTKRSFMIYDLNQVSLYDIEDNLLEEKVL